MTTQAQPPVDLSRKAEELKAQMHKANPSNAAGVLPERERIPMSAPMRKLEVPPIPGYHLHWMRGTAQRLAQAQRAGYEFVSPEEVQLNSFDIGGDAKTGGSTDMGSRVSIVAGDYADDAGNAVRMYLMKLKMEHWNSDQAVLARRNDAIADSLTAAFQTGVMDPALQGAGNKPAEQATDVANRYVKPSMFKIPELFRRKNRKP